MQSQLVAKHIHYVLLYLLLVTRSSAYEFEQGVRDDYCVGLSLPNRALPIVS